MELWDKLTGEFVDVIEWIDDGSGDTLVWRFDRQGNAIKLGAQLTVRQSQWAVFVNEGRIADAFGPGRYRLETRNLPILTSLLSLPYAFESPYKAEVYFVSTRQFTDQKWGTRHPVIVRDAELGPVRLRGFGTYALRVSDPARLIREVSGTSGRFDVEGISEQLRDLIVSGLADLLGESRRPVLDLAARYEELAAELRQRLAAAFGAYGIELTTLLIETLTLPPEVEAALDRRSGVELSGDLGRFTTYQRGIALEKAAANPGGAAAVGAGLAMGFAMGGGSAAAGPFHLMRDGQSRGPYALADLVALQRQGELKAGTLVWHPGLQAWQAAAGIAALASLFEAPPLPAAPPTPPPAAP